MEEKVQSQQAVASPPAKPKNSPSTSRAVVFDVEKWSEWLAHADSSCRIITIGSSVGEIHVFLAYCGGASHFFTEAMMLSDGSGWADDDDGLGQPTELIDQDAQALSQRYAGHIREQVCSPFARCGTKIVWFERHEFTDEYEGLEGMGHRDAGGRVKFWGKQGSWRVALLAALEPELRDLDRLRPIPKKRKSTELPSTLFHDGPSSPPEKKQKPKASPEKKMPAFVIPDLVDDDEATVRPTMLFESKAQTLKEARPAAAAASGSGGTGASEGRKEEFKFASATVITEGKDKGKARVDMDDLMDF